MPENSETFYRFNSVDADKKISATKRGEHFLWNITQEATPYDQIVDSPDATTDFIGKAVVGTKEDEPKWQIVKVSVIGTQTVKRYANGSTAFDKVWDERANYLY